MSVLRNDYDLSKHVDEVWYESSNVVYSRFEEDKDENKGDLYVVFKGGKQYVYKSVSYQNYLYFKHGGLSGSSGKALNEYIIKKYAAEKLEDVDIDAILRRMNTPGERDVTYFIHGNGNIDEDTFHLTYENTISYVVESSCDNRFAIKYSDECGRMSLEFLSTLQINPDRITIYASGRDADNLDPKHHGCRIVRLHEDECDDDFLDGEIIKRTFDDIGYVSPDELEEIGKISRPAYIILKRRMG